MKKILATFLMLVLALMGYSQTIVVNYSSQTLCVLPFSYFCYYHGVKHPELVNISNDGTISTNEDVYVRFINNKCLTIKSGFNNKINSEYILFYLNDNKCLIQLKKNDDMLSCH
jgi:hypothetical protein